MSSFADMKRQTKDFDALARQLEPQRNTYKDDRVYYPERDDQGNGFAIIRFLPAPEGEDAPFAFTGYHSFETPSGKYFRQCRRAVDVKEECPVCDYANEWIADRGGWKTLPKNDQDFVRKYFRRKQYICNIMVVQDKQNPENEGQVFLFKFGPKILEKIKLALEPEFEDDPQFDAFDLWTGANFKLKIRKVKGQTNYDVSTFDKPAALSDDDAELEAIWKREYKLAEFSDLEGEYYPEVEDTVKHFNNIMRIKADEKKPSEEGFRKPEDKKPDAAADGKPLFDPDEDVFTEEKAPAGTETDAGAEHFQDAPTSEEEDVKGMFADLD